MRKVVSLFLALALSISALGVPVFAQPQEETAAPYATNVLRTDVTLEISSNGIATITSVCIGISGTTSIRATTYLERDLSGRWFRVDIPEADDQWVSSTTSRIYSVTKTHQLTIQGTYRAVTVFTVTAGSGETFVATAEATF